ncbi:MAG: dihydrodipicolinate synthase family protein [Acidobacteriaceae bacterium]|nr:dihydrodipicolinate synthase family protein [Acidobacteriaceae bacterium]
MALPVELASQSVASGVYAALLTPRRPDSIDADTAAFLEYLDAVAEGGASGLVLFGSTGEFVHFDLEERMRATSLAVKRSRLPVLVNISHSALPGAVQLAQQAFDTGAQGVLLMPPYFYHYSEHEIAEFYAAFFDTTQDLGPVYLYSLPFYTNPLSMQLMRELLSSGKFAGIKDSSGDWAVLEELFKIRGQTRFQLLVGNEIVYLRGLLGGADGIISGVAGALPELPVAMERAVKTGDSAAAESLGVRLDEFMAWVARFPASAAIKSLAEARGWIRANFATPLGNNTRQELLKFRGWLQAWLSKTLDECAAVGSVRT